MKHAVVDKRVAGIIKWLERLKKSYSSGAIETALMDAECAKADLENLRQDVWANLRPKEKSGHKKFFSRLINFSRVAVLSALIILLAVFPVARDLPAPAMEHELDKKNLVLVEPIKVIVIREDKEEIIKDDRREIKKAKPAPVATNRPKSVKINSVKQESLPVKKQEPEKVVAYDKVFSLIQTGQKALKKNNSVIINNK